MAPVEEKEVVGTALSKRIVVHLAMLPPLSRTMMATLAYTQQGMAESLGESQSSFVRALQRLEEAGLVTKEVRAVAGQTRRLKVYSLTQLGKSFARYLHDQHVGSGDRRVIIRPRRAGVAVRGD